MGGGDARRLAGTMLINHFVHWFQAISVNMNAEAQRKALSASQKAASSVFANEGCGVYTHMTRSQLELKQARCKISNKGYLSLNILIIFYHSMVIRSWDITTIPKGLSETFFGKF